MNFVLPTYSPGYISRGNRRLEGIFHHDLKKAVALRDGWRPKWDRSKYILKPDLKTVLATLKAMTKRSSRVAYDIETNGKHPLNCQVRCIAFHDGKTTICVPFFYRDGTFTMVTVPGRKKQQKISNWFPYWSAENLVKVLSAMQLLFNTCQLDTQNGQFDRLGMRAAFGVVIPSANVTGNFDTILGHHVVSSYMPHGLGFLGSIYTEAPYYKSTDSGSAWSSSSDHDLWTYCCDDVVVTRGAATPLRAEIDEREGGIDRVIYEHDSWQEQECERWRWTGIEVDRRAIALLQLRYGVMRDKALAAMRGLLLKQSRKKTLSPQLDELLGKLSELSEKEDDLDEDEKGNESVSSDDAPVRLFNPASLRQLRLLLAHLGVPLTEETATGEVSTAKEFLLGARKQLFLSAKKNAVPIEFLDYLFAWREASKLYSTYLHPEILPDGRLHANYNVHVVPTGRLSSSGPNLTNQPAEVRGMFVARKGHVLVAGDWDALEMRLGGLASGDRTFIDDFAAYDAGIGPKVHITNMVAIFGMEAQWEKALKQAKGDKVKAGSVLADLFPGCYRAAKVFAYAAAYGAGPITVFEKVREEMPDMDFKTFQDCFARYKKYRKGLFEFQAGVVKTGTVQQYLDSPILQRRVHFFERVFGSDSPEASAMQNMPYQSGGSDCVSKANRRLMVLVEEWRRTRLLPVGAKYKNGKLSMTVTTGEVLEQLAQVHDELLFEVPEGFAEEFAAAFKRITEEPVDGGAHKHWYLPVDVKIKKPVRPGAPSRWKPLHYPAPCCEKDAVVEVLDEKDGSVVWVGACENDKCKKHKTEFTVTVN